MFTPFSGYVEIELLPSENIIADDKKTFIEVGKIIQVGAQQDRTGNYTYQDDFFLKEGDIIFFRPHGCFETPEYEGKKHYVVRVHEEFILGKISQ